MEFKRFGKINFEDYIIVRFSSHHPPTPEILVEMFRLNPIILQSY